MMLMVSTESNISTDFWGVMSRLNYKLLKTATGSRARAGTMRTLHATVETPVFMPVGTQAAVKGLRSEDLQTLGFNIILGNTYHLLLRPGPDVFKKFGGIHKFAQWPRAVLTDSGGFQIFSLPNARKMREEGAEFRSYIDGTKILLSPELSIGMQRAIGSDIMMVLDECVPSTTDYADAQRAMHLTHRWALRSLAAREDSPQSMFAIVQGACFEKLREESASFLREHPFDGFAIGGLAVGETKGEREHFTEYTTQFMPEHLPRYLMGVGTPIDLLEAVHRGVDMFDCIIPAAHAQQGTAFSHTGQIRLRRGVYKFSEEPIDSNCGCDICSKYSRAYIHHLIKAGEGLGWRLIVWHNLYFYRELMMEMRRHILADTFATYYAEKRKFLVQSDVEFPTVQPKINKVKQPTAGNFQINLGSDGLGRIQQISSGEVMHPESYPDKEAHDLYVEKSSLPARLTINPNLVIWDVGLGVAHNAMAAIRSAENQWSINEDATSKLHMISFENDLDAMKLGITHVPWFPHLKHGAPHLLYKNGTWRSKDERIIWELKHSDFAEEIIRPLPLPDIVFYDPFSFKVDSKLWSFEAFKKLAKTCDKQPFILVTYSTSTAVRAAMLAAGLYVFKTAGTGKRQEATVAVNHLEWERYRSGSFEATFEHLIPLGEEWLSRWERSSSKAPYDVDADQRGKFESLVTTHGQWVTVDNGK